MSTVSRASGMPWPFRVGVELYAYPLTSEGDESDDERGLLVENEIQLFHEEAGARHGIIIRHTTWTGWAPIDFHHHRTN
jgi:hypothetical protein